MKSEEVRQRCHGMLDKLEDPAVVERAYQYLKYLYIHVDGIKKAAPSVASTESGSIKGTSNCPHCRDEKGDCQDES